MSEDDVTARLLAAERSGYERALREHGLGGYEPALADIPLPLHRTEAGWPNCSTCDGSGCPDCTDPA